MRKRIISVRSFQSSIGFTLIELLVVITIIAILTAILFPVFARAREQARKTMCLSNSRQIGTALTLYFESWDNLFPSQWWDKSGCDEWFCTWAHQLHPFIKTSKVWVCPSKGRGDPDPIQTGFISYGMNWFASHDPQDGRIKSFSELERPVETVVITETGGCTDRKRIGGSVGSGACDGAWLDTFWLINSYPNVKTYIHPGTNTNTNHRFQTQHGKHNGTVNIIYADGHAKNLRPSQLTWGNFFGKFNPNYNLFGMRASAPVAPPQWDNIEIEP